MRMCQYFAYVEIIDERESDMFPARPTTARRCGAPTGPSPEKWPNFADERASPSRPTSIPVFRKLFAKQPSQKGR